MQVTIRLVPDGPDYVGMAVTGITNTDTTNGVEIFFSGNIIEIKSFRTNDLDGQGRGGSLAQVLEEKLSLVHCWKAKIQGVFDDR
jgi:hypothetical protein